MNTVKTITSFTNVIMNMILQCYKGKQSLFQNRIMMNTTKKMHNKILT